MVECGIFGVAADEEGPESVKAWDAEVLCSIPDEGPAIRAYEVNLPVIDVTVKVQQATRH